VVPEYDRLVVFRLGRSIGHKGPGLVWLWPIVDRAVAIAPAQGGGPERGVCAAPPPSTPASSGSGSPSVLRSKTSPLTGLQS